MSALDYVLAELAELAVEFAERAAETSPDPEDAARWRELAELCRGLESDLEVTAGRLVITDFDGHRVIHPLAVAPGAYYEVNLGRGDGAEIHRIRVEFPPC